MKTNAWSSKKHLTVIALLLVLVSTLIAGCGKKDEEYRQIQVYKIDGTVTVERQGSSMEAYDNMQLQSGDIIETVEDSYLQLKLDEDKYIMLEPETKISLQATGNSVDSKTSIYLEKGAIVNQLDHSLSEDSSYQVTTPNSTMAVRGTTFRVEITYDEKGHSYAKVAVFGGKVECHLVFPDGTIAEPVMVEPGTEVLVWGDDVESDYIEFGNTNYEELKEKVIDFLGAIIDRGEELSLTKEEIEVLKEGLAVLEEEDAIDEGEREEDSEEESSEEESVQEETKQGLEESSSTVDEAVGTIETEQSEEKKEETKTEETPSANPAPPVVVTPGDSSSSGSGNTSGGGSASGSGNTSREININFCLSDGTVFATKKQSVDSNATEISKSDITKPLLQPTASGSWEYESADTITIVNDVVTIKWVSN